MKIKVLPDAVINQIAAGEVVERPASVVRELVDNAVDSGATDVFVAIEAGGHSRLRIRDNGCGMTRDEVILAFERHATSKVSCIQDLWHLSTMGFRGEALASIASVAKVKLTSRSLDGDVGTQVIFRGGKLINVESCPWSEGTEIEVEHLFFNTPARRKFLKSPRSEIARIRTWLVHSSLTRPGVRYRLVSDGDEIVNLPAVESIPARAAYIFSDGLMPFSLSEGGIGVQGMLAHPGQAISDTSGLVVIVNGRLVSDKLVIRAVREGFDSMLKDREFPVGYIVLEVPPEQVDVNVHPQKSEVRFRHPDQVFAIVQGGVLSAIRRIKAPVSSLTAMRESVQSPLPRAESLPIHVPVLSTPANGDESPGATISAPVWGQVAVALQPSFFVNDAAATYAATDIAPAFRFSSLRYIGQLLQCYLLCEARDKLVIVDMHAAHERINYNRIRSARARHELKIQELLLPETIRLPEEQVVTLMEQSDLLKELAFEVDAVGYDTVVVRGVPSVLAHLDCRSLVKEFASEPLVLGWRERLEERIDHITARLACHASVRSGDLIQREEVYSLFEQLDAADLAGACPHGRPVVAEFSREAVERWFGRDR